MGLESEQEGLLFMDDKRQEGETKVRDFLSGCIWRFAKSMPEIPHWYIVRANVNDSLFVESAIFIRKHGYKKRFGSRTYLYYDLDGYSYWTMGNPIEETTIINRAEIK